MFSKLAPFIFCSSHSEENSFAALSFIAQLETEHVQSTQVPTPVSKVNSVADPNNDTEFPSTSVSAHSIQLLPTTELDSMENTSALCIPIENAPLMLREKEVTDKKRYYREE